VTICNIYSFGYFNERESSRLEFFNKVRETKAQWPYDRMASVLSDLTEDEYVRVWESLLFPTSYISSMNIPQVMNVSQSQPLIVDCFLSGAPDIACDDIKHFTWNPVYQRCYTIHVPENVTEVRRSISVISRVKPRALSNSLASCKYTVSQKASSMF